ncbi:MerR family transcriptional regulator [Ktedonobacter robiniae]|uniref:HTH merR-type domain-containing protein n=1 Tax=Ktedonobacter robiniae TaxID=2778365 RepID=A0ABQ3V4Q9_9CHLR|nr:MerR family transcriptional regulator [Ktedonobacter robiniae]GHO59947.1 hypothetical protein KSB_84220 [Ktedonobacter robiniae]
MEDILTLRNSESFSIQEMSKQSGLTEPTLRYYEKIGLFKPVPRDPRSGHRRYTAEIARAVHALACLHASGFSIEAMRAYLQLLEEGTKGAAQQKELFAAHAKELECQIERLQVRKEYLKSKEAYWDAVERGDADAVERVTEEIRRIIPRLT